MIWKMAGFSIFVIVCFLMLSPINLLAEQPKAKTLAELIKRYDVSSCKKCHTQIFDQWEKSLHARSIIGTPRTLDAFSRMVKNYLLSDQWKYAGVKKIEDIKIEHLMPCLECHLPQTKFATDDVAVEIAKAAVNGDLNTLSKLSINCLVCHHDKAIIHQWVDGPPEDNVIYGNKSGKHEGVSYYSMIKKSLVLQESIFCGQCHGLGPGFHYPNPVHCAMLYGSYLNAYIPSGGTKTCQDCHMEKGHFMSAYSDSDMAKKAVRVDVETLAYYFHPKAFEWTPLAVVTVRMTCNAGHRIPDG